MSPRQKRLTYVAVGIVALALATAFVLNAFRSNLVFFFTPTQVAQGEAPQNRVFRLGGLVKAGSLQRNHNQIEFVITDTQRDIPVQFSGLLPDLFQEGKGVVAQGQLNAQGAFMASEVLAKHDENYMPPEAQHALDRATADKAARSLRP
jgi:cytochrome c-type biogenesis protein CcmE